MGEIHGGRMGPPSTEKAKGGGRNAARYGNSATRPVVALGLRRASHRSKVGAVVRPPRTWARGFVSVAPRPHYRDTEVKP